MHHMKPIFVKANEKDQGTASLEAGIQLSIAWGFSKQPRKARIMDELLPLARKNIGLLGNSPQS